MTVLAHFLLNKIIRLKDACDGRYVKSSADLFVVVAAMWILNKFRFYFHHLRWQGNQKFSLMYHPVRGLGRSAR